jgi:formylglycine-generating enzyme required for sulfatase activity
VVSAGENAAGPPKEIVTSIGLKMALIPGGSFVMGSASGKDDERPPHEVTLDPFYVDVHEVTQEAYQSLTGANPSKFGDAKGPVERIRWTEAAVFCNKRSEKEGLKPCYDTETWECDFAADGYRLPTEAEWERACRGGTTEPFFFKGGETVLANYAWFRANSGEKSHKVGQKRANPFGLFDVYGNVAEWCNDWYDPAYYLSSPGRNPVGPAKGAKRALRGGSWASRGKNVSSHARAADNPVFADICLGYDTYGFRCVRRITRE